MKLSGLKLNPKNPRLIRDDKFKKLCKSLQDFPQMMELRPIVVNEDGIIQGGNMRYRALKELGYKEIPDNWVKQGKDLTPEQWNEFVIKDNVGFGIWDWDILANEWDSDLLEDWGVDLPSGWGNDIPVNNMEQVDKDLSEIVVVAYDDLNTLDKLTTLYELNCIDMTDKVKEQLSYQSKMYVFKE